MNANMNNSNSLEQPPHLSKLDVTKPITTGHTEKLPPDIKDTEKKEISIENIPSIPKVTDNSVAPIKGDTTGLSENQLVEKLSNDFINSTKYFDLVKKLNEIIGKLK